MTSSRLPGKVLMPLAGRPSILFMHERVCQAKSIDAVCVATSDDPSDDPLAEAVASGGGKVHRGSLHDVLDRFLGAARGLQGTRIVRLTGDCPLVDPSLIDAVLGAMESANADYASNVAPPTFPDGLDVEAFTMPALERAATEARLTSEREHVTPFIRNAPFFKRVNLASPVDLSGLRWTVDYHDDYQLVMRMVETVRGDPLKADRFDYLRAYECLAGEVPRHLRNEGLAASIANDRLTDPA